MSKKVLIIIILIALILVVSSFFIFNNNPQTNEEDGQNQIQDNEQEEPLDEVIAEFPDSSGEGFPVDIFG